MCLNDTMCVGRTKYITALQDADNWDYTKLIDFVK